MRSQDDLELNGVSFVLLNPPAELGGADAEGFSDSYDIFNAGIAKPAFDAADVRGVEVCAFSEFFLSEILYGPLFADRAPKSGENGVGVCHAP